MSESLKEKIYAKMETLTIASLATITSENTPWVRYVTISADNDLTVWLSTFAASKKIIHISKNNKVHLVLGVKDLQTAKSYIQIQGKAEILDDEFSKKRVWTEALNNYFTGIDDPNMKVCRITPYQIEYNDMNPKTPSEIWTP